MTVSAAWPVRRALTAEYGTALPAFVDHHVHLHLIDASTLSARGIAAVVDLGGDPVALARRARGLPRVSYAGAFLTAPGGYPQGRSWAPDATVRPVTDASRHPGVTGGARTAVDAQADAGASVIKVALHADAGPVVSDDVLVAIVAAAGERGLPVVAHAQGAGQVERAIEAGVAALAHTPFDAPLSRRALSRAVAAGQAWISTLDIHRGAAREQAITNLRAFAARGGRVLYGTDLGNGSLPVGLNRRELLALHDAGVRGDALVAALTDAWPHVEPTSAVSTFVPGPAPTDPDDLPTWLSRGTVVTTEELTRVD
ncbi:imidazolonepropionase-like amidohydrolase [Microbacterium proteolyticum]|uniref:Imidazolonepropionase-like amidohydrolase n=1 Tax=Microbacterium proteolyticum TaxID=1572644 RepID=A0A7W5CGI9_9MICO|nr:imidazolonepropionase-like amidohydrolase [Microbacterium proteolyticum]